MIERSRVRIPSGAVGEFSSPGGGEGGVRGGIGLLGTDGGSCFLVTIRLRCWHRLCLFSFSDI